MTNLILGISLTLNVITILGLFIYLKIKTLGVKKMQKDMMKNFFCTDEELDDALEKL